MSFSASQIRKDFPIFERTVRGGKRLVYLDSGATSQKPISVIDAESDFYKLHNAAVHRGAHQLAEEATDAYEGARQIVADFLGAPGGADEIIFTKSATESLNLLAYAMGNAPIGNRFALKNGDRIVVTEMEHHANLVPWQQLCARTGADLAWFGVTDDGRLDLSNINEVITPNTKVVSLTHQSNVLGTINPLSEITTRAHEVGAIVVLDACQSVPHMAVNVETLGVDFLAFSGHKTLGPTGVGILWGRKDLLDELPPFLYGGSMVQSVDMTGATWAAVPQKFEAGVPNMAQAVGLGVALKYLTQLGMDNVSAHEHALTGYLLEKMSLISDLTVVGPTNNLSRGSAISFTLGNIHPHDVGQYLDSQGVAVRTGHHCAWPLAKRMQVPATTRASLYVYNDESDCDVLIDAIQGASKYFGGR
ncbi:MAG: cysteine desulfurase-like protein, SufS subfamily [Actinobacteria bacterium]|jgi:cysteine desulfurase/selenocysteine lyase|nr:cysteine desulfurase-like protein, SufS subfamily [Actinomycetota bacterium]